MGNFLRPPRPRGRAAGGAVELARLAGQIGLEPGCRNPFKSILARVFEVLYALGEARRLIGEYRVPEAPAIDCPPRAGSNPSPRRSAPISRSLSSVTVSAMRAPVLPLSA